ncbi:hypothetical protein GCM10008931_09380 [Oceanobacillus oncorhynchi subsp. oncorhynchi]
MRIATNFILLLEGRIVNDNSFQLGDNLIKYMRKRRRREPYINLIKKRNPYEINENTFDFIRILNDKAC